MSRNNTNDQYCSLITINLYNYKQENYLQYRRNNSLIMIFFALIEVGLIIYSVSVLKKINSFTQENEVRFWSLYIKKSTSQKNLKKIQAKILFTYAHDSLRNKIAYWTERCIIDFGFLGGSIWLFIVIGFNLDLKLSIPSLICFMLVIPNFMLLSNQLYHFWKNQPIWKERSIEEQPFLLPNTEDHKRLNKYWLQLFASLYLIMAVGTYFAF